MEKYLKEIDVGIGLSDSELIIYTYNKEDDKLVIQIQAWDASILKIHCFHHILLIDHGCSDITLFCENTSPSGILKTTLENFYVDKKIPENNPYKLYQFMNLDDNPSMEIICEAIQIFRE